MVESVASTTVEKSADSDLHASVPAYVFGRRLAPLSPAMSAPLSMSALMERYAAGDDEVFERLYGLLAPRLYRFCLRLAGRAPEADDCFQETFLKLHRARATFVAGGNALHWAFAIARSVYLSRLRHARRRPEDVGAHSDIGESEALLPTDGTSPETHVAAADILGVVSQELAKMSEKNRSAYVLIKEESLSAKEAAAVLGTTPNAVKQRAHRAYEDLRAALEAAGWRNDGTDAS